jgi:hypothetical protein
VRKALVEDEQCHIQIPTSYYLCKGPGIDIGKEAACGPSVYGCSMKDSAAALRQVFRHIRPRCLSACPELYRTTIPTTWPACCGDRPAWQTSSRRGGECDPSACQLKFATDLCRINAKPHTSRSSILTEAPSQCNAILLVREYSLRENDWAKVADGLLEAVISC